MSSEALAKEVRFPLVLQGSLSFTQRTQNNNIHTFIHHTNYPASNHLIFKLSYPPILFSVFSVHLWLPLSILFLFDGTQMTRIRRICADLQLSVISCELPVVSCRLWVENSNFALGLTQSTRSFSQRPQIEIANKSDTS